MRESFNKRDDKASIYRLLAAMLTDTTRGLKPRMRRILWPRRGESFTMEEAKSQVCRKNTCKAIIKLTERQERTEQPRVEAKEALLLPIILNLSRKANKTR